jgi:ATP-dependent DNA helicase RecQ
MPAFIVMHDTSLEELCRVRPKSLRELNSVNGFGERKIEAYGQQILEALRDFERGARAVIPQERKSSPAEETLRLLNEGKSLGEIAVLRQRQMGTVVNTVAALVEQGDISFDEKWVDPTRRSVIEAACMKVGIQWLKPIKEALPADISFEDIRLVVARLRWLETTKKQPA